MMDYRAELVALCIALEAGDSDAHEEAADTLVALRAEPDHIEPEDR